MLFKLLLITPFVLAATPSSIKQEARELLEKHQFAKSLKKANELLKLNRTEALYLRSHVYLAQGKLKKAYLDAVEANKAIPGSISELLLHKVELERENYKEASRHIDNARRLYDYTDSSLLNRINLAQLKFFYETKNYNSLIEYWKGNNFGAVEYWADLWAARAYWELGREFDARETLDIVLDIERDAQFLLYRAQFSSSSEKRTSLLLEAEAKVRKELEEGLYGHRAELAEILLAQEDAKATVEALDILNAELKIRNSRLIRRLLSKAWSLKSRSSFQNGHYGKAVIGKINSLRFRIL